MVPFFADLLSFFLKTLIVILVVSIPVGLVFAAVLKSKGKKRYEQRDIKRNGPQ